MLDQRIQKSKRASGRRITILQILLLASLLFTSNLSADLSSLTLNSATVSSCQDYFTSEWQEPLDMSNTQDVLFNIVPRESQHLSTYSYSGGVFSTTTTGIDPMLRILSWSDGGADHKYDLTRFGLNKPINPSSSPFYEVLTMRMYTDQASDIQVLWDKPDSVFAISNPVTTSTGWNTYQIDLSSIGINDGSGNNSWLGGNITGLRIDPSRNKIGAQIKFDWMQLTPDSSNCSSVGINYVAAATDRVSLFVDDDTDPTTGWLYQSDSQSGGSGSHSVSSNLFFPGSYYVYALTSKDYASLLRINPWDMDDGATDIDTSYQLNNIAVSGTGFSGGQFCGTATGSQPNFYLKLAQGKPIDASVYNKFSIELTQSYNTPDFVVLTWFDTNGGVLGSHTVATTGSGSYSSNLSGVSGWSGSIGALRIIPALGMNANDTFCINYVALATETLGAVSTPSVFGSTPSQVTLSKRYVSKIEKPDLRGGEDYFTKVQGNPSNMSSSDDIKLVDNLVSASIYPASSYTDSAGNVRTGDFFHAKNVTGSDDPQNFSVFLDYDKPIDPTRYKIACFTLDILLPITNYHSVARVLWQRNGTNVNGDDIVLGTNGEREYCLRLDTLKIEPDVDPGPNHPWQKNSDGTGINFWRIDAHEDAVDPNNSSTGVEFRFQEIRLAADHEANTQYALVIGGDRDAAVSVYYNTTKSTSGGTLITTLSANRNSDIVLWDTSALSEGTYWTYVTIGGNSYLAPAPVIVTRAVSDTTAPVLDVDAPLAGHRFTTSLELALGALDEVRIASVEVKLDGQYLTRVEPNTFNKELRDAYPSYPNSSSALYQGYVDTSSITLGDHTIEIKAYDTAGNTTTHTATITRVASDPTTPVVYSSPNESPITIATPVPTPSATPTPTPALTVSVKQDTLTANIKGISACSTVRLIGNFGVNNNKEKIYSNAPVTIYSTSNNSSSTIKLVASKLTALKANVKGNTTLNFIADCGAQSSAGGVKKVDAKKIIAKKRNLKNPKAALNLIKKKAKKK